MAVSCAYPVMGDVPVADVGTEHVMAAIWKTKPETASRVRGRIERVLDSAGRGDSGKVKIRPGGAAMWAR